MAAAGGRRYARSDQRGSGYRMSPTDSLDCTQKPLNRSRLARRRGPAQLQPSCRTKLDRFSGFLVYLSESVRTHSRVIPDPTRSERAYRRPPAATQFTRQTHSSRQENSMRLTTKGRFAGHRNDRPGLALGHRPGGPGSDQPAPADLAVVPGATVRQAAPARAGGGAPAAPAAAIRSGAGRPRSRWPTSSSPMDRADRRHRLRRRGESCIGGAVDMT